MITIIRTNSENKAFNKLVQLLNSDLADRDGASHPLSQFNTMGHIKYVVLVYENNEAVACGAIEEFDMYTMEMKRIYVSAEFRGKKIGTNIISELENWAKELGYVKCILFTGMNQPEAKKLYEKNAYKQIQKYGKLANIADCICFAKDLKL